MKKIYSSLLFFFFLFFSLQSYAQAPVAGFTCTSGNNFPFHNCGTFNLTFTNTSIGSYDSAEWIIQNNTTGCAGPWTNAPTVLTVADITYSGAQLHNNLTAPCLLGYNRVCLRVVNSVTHQSSTYCQCVAQVYDIPQAHFTATPNSACGSVTAHFVPGNPGTIPPYTFSWTFGNGNPSSIITSCSGVPSASCGDTTITYSCNNPPSSTYPVFLIVNDGHGCTGIDSDTSAKKAVTVYCGPGAPTIAVGSGNTCVTGQPISLTATPSGLCSYTWYLTGKPTIGPSASNTATTSFSQFGCYDAKLVVAECHGTFSCYDSASVTNAVCLQGLANSATLTVTSPTPICSGTPFQVDFVSNTNPVGGCVSANIVAVPVGGSPACATTIQLGTLQSCNGQPGTQNFSISSACNSCVNYVIKIDGDSIINPASGCSKKNLIVPGTNIQFCPAPDATITLAPGYLNSYCAQTHAFKFNASTIVPNLPCCTYAWYSDPAYTVQIGSTSTCTYTFTGFGPHTAYLKVCQCAANGGCCAFGQLVVNLSRPFGTFTWDNSVGCGTVTDSFYATVTTDSFYKWFFWDSAGLTTVSGLGSAYSRAKHTFTGFYDRDTCYNVWLLHVTKAVGGVFCFDTIKKTQVVTIGHHIKPKFTISTNKLCLKRDANGQLGACLYVYPDSTLHLLPKPGHPLSQCSGISCRWYFTKVKSTTIVQSTSCDNAKICFNSDGKYIPHFVITDNTCTDTLTLTDTVYVSALTASYADSVWCSAGNVYTHTVTFKPSAYIDNARPADSLGALPAGDKLHVHLWVNALPPIDLLDTIVAPGHIPSRINYTFLSGGGYTVCMSAFDTAHAVCGIDTTCRRVSLSTIKANIVLQNNISSGCRPATFIFDGHGSTPSPNPQTNEDYPPVRVWSWGDGKPNTTGVIQTTHTYDTCGIFSVNLHLANTTQSCQDDVQVIVTVHDMFNKYTKKHQDLVTVKPLTSSCNLCGVFYNNSAFCLSSISTTFINFGDGSVNISGTWDSIIHCWQSIPSAQCYYKVTDIYGCFVEGYFSPPSLTGLALKIQGPSDTNICVGSTIVVQSQSTGIIDHYLWKLSNYSDGCGNNPILPNTTVNGYTHTFGTQGDYLLKFHIDNNYGCFQDTCIPIHVENAVACVLGSDTFNCPGSVDTLTNCSTGAYDSLIVTLYLPGFGTSNPIIYNYSKHHSVSGIPKKIPIPLGYTGKYSVSVQAYSAMCQSTTTKDIYVKGPTGQFHALTHSACLGDTVHFTDTTNSINGVLIYWAGEGYLNIPYDTSHKYKFGHAFTTCGFKTISAFISDGSCIYPLKDTVRIDCPKAKFGKVVSSANFCGCATVNLKDSSLSSYPTVYGTNILSYKWTVSDSTTGAVIQTFNTQNPVFHTCTPGIYSVKLWIQTNWGCVDSSTQTGYIKVYNTTVAQFNLQPDTICVNGCVQFTNTSINPDSAFGPSHYRWYFDWNINGKTSTVVSPIECYTVPGTYTAILIDSSIHGCVDTSSTKNVVVLPGIIPNFNRSDTLFCANQGTVNFTNTSFPATGLAYCWNFGDTTSTNICQASTLNTTHTFFLPTNSPQTCYTVKLITTNLVGCKDSITKQICLYALPIAGLTTTPPSSCTPLSITVFDNSITTAAVNQSDIQLFWGDTTKAPLIGTPNGTQHHYHWVNTDTGTFHIVYILKTQQGCVDTFRTDVISYPYPNVCAGRDTLVCAKQLITLGCPSLPLSGYTYNWYQPVGIVGFNTPHPIITAYHDETYYLRMVDSISGCPAIDSMKVHTIPLVSASAGPDTAICIGQCIVLSAHGGITYTWRDVSSQPFSIDSIINLCPKVTGQYTVNVCGACDCQTIPINVQVFLPPVINIEHDINDIVSGHPVRIDSVAHFGYGAATWWPDYQINCTNCLSPTVNPYITTTYHVSVMDGHGCVDSDQVTIHILCDASNAVYVPNAFTPGSSTSGMHGIKNDRFFVAGQGGQQVNYLRIYNRWGGIVYQVQNVPVNDYNSGWDGTFNGNPMSSDIYMYQLEVQCSSGAVFPLTGTLTLIR